MSELDDIRARVEALEADRPRADALEIEMDRLRAESLRAGAMATPADQEVSDVRVTLRAHERSLNALRASQREQTVTLNRVADAVGALVAGQVEHGRRLDSMDGRLGSVDGRLDLMEGCLGRIEAGQAEILQAVRDLRAIA